MSYCLEIFLTNLIFPRSSLSGAEESNEAGRNGEIVLHLSSAIHICDTSSSYMAIDQPILGEMLVKLMTSESEKSHGSMMLRLSDMGSTKGG